MEEEEGKDEEGKEQEVEMKKVDNDRKEEKPNDGNSKEDSTEEKNTSDRTEEGNIAENYGIDPMDEEKDEASSMQQTVDANGIKIENEKVIPFEEGTENGLVLTIEVNLVKIESNEVDQDGIQELDDMEIDVRGQPGKNNCLTTRKQKMAMTRKPLRPKKILGLTQRLRKTRFLTTPKRPMR